MKKLIILLLPAIIITSCRTYSKAPAYGETGGVSTRSKFEDNEYLRGGNDFRNPADEFNRVVIYNASIGLAVKNADTVNANLVRLAARYKGYALTLGNSSSTIRVKSIMLHDAVADIAKLGKVKYKSIYGQDVTDDYVDSQIRLDNAKKARQRYLELLAKAENVQAALMVEKELERLNKEIDQLEGHLKRLDHLSEYSTITVGLDKKVKPGVLGYIGMGLYYSVKWLFVRN